MLSVTQKLLMLSVVMLSVVMMSVIMLSVVMECRYDECRYAECHGATKIDMSAPAVKCTHSLLTTFFSYNCLS